MGRPHYPRHPCLQKIASDFEKTDSQLSYVVGSIPYFVSHGGKSVHDDFEFPGIGFREGVQGGLAGVDEQRGKGDADLGELASDHRGVLPQLAPEALGEDGRCSLR